MYYTQVDVVDSEYSVLRKNIFEATEFQSALRAHKNFLSNVLRLSLIDNISIQESIERILQACLRFIAICRILHQSDCNSSNNNDDEQQQQQQTQESIYKNTAVTIPPIYVPPEELIHIQKDFFAQIAVLFQTMNKVDSRGFIFRLDFNGFLSRQQQQQ